MKKKESEKRFEERIKKILEEHACDRYLLFVESKGKGRVLYKADSENDLVKLIVSGVLGDLRDKPERQEFLRTVLLSAVTGDAYGSGWWDRLRKVVEELDRHGSKWFGRA